MICDEDARPSLAVAVFTGGGGGSPVVCPRQLAGTAPGACGSADDRPFWGVTCGPCLAELPRWGELIREQPGVDIVMVAADPVAVERNTIASVLAKAGCAAAESWIFADPFTDRLTYEVDPSWAGELPFTLLVKADASVKTILG